MRKSSCPRKISKVIVPAVTSCNIDVTIDEVWAGCSFLSLSRILSTSQANFMFFPLIQWAAQSISSQQIPALFQLPRCINHVSCLFISSGVLGLDIFSLYGYRETKEQFHGERRQCSRDYGGFCWIEEQWMRSPQAWWVDKRWSQHNYHLKGMWESLFWRYLRVAKAWENRFELFQIPYLTL